MTAPAFPAHRTSVRGHHTLTLAIVLACQLMVVLDATIVNIALPEIKHALHFSPTGLSWVLNAYTLTFGGLLLLGARAGDIFGRRRMFVGGLTLFTLASLAGGFSDSAAALLVARAAQGIGGAFAAPAGLALLMSMFTDGRERTRALGSYTAVSVGGAALGLIAGGVLTQWASWRWVLFVNVPIGAVVVVLAVVVLQETQRRPGQIDYAGALTSTLGMSSLVYGLVRAASNGWSDDLTLGAFAVGLALMGGFVFIEQRAVAAIVPLRLFADRNRCVSYISRLLLTSGMMGMFFFLTQFLQTVLGYSALATGFGFVPMTFFVFASSNLSARVFSEHFSARALIVGGLTVSVIGLAWLTQLSAGSSYLDVLGPLMLFGFGNGTAFVPLTATAMRGIDPADAGAASGMINVMQQVGGSVGLAVLVTVFGSATTHVGIVSTNPIMQARHVFTVGADRGFLTATILVAVALVLCAAVIRAPHEPQHITELELEVAEIELASM